MSDLKSWHNSLPDAEPELEQKHIKGGAKAERKPTWDPEYVRDLSVLVYRQRLSDGGGSPERMIEEDEDHGEKLRGRAASYDPLTRAYLKVLGFEPPQHS